jgi:hypothetical protein
MAIHDRPRTHADEARAALRLLAHATRDVADPTEVYPVLGELSNGLELLARSLHQIGDFHEEPARKRAWVTGDPGTGRAASYKVTWELHRAAEMVHQVATGIEYDVRDFPTLVPAPRTTREPGLSL